MHVPSGFAKNGDAHARMPARDEWWKRSREQGGRDVGRLLTLKAPFERQLRVVRR
jgi:hypothetical protein